MLWPCSISFCIVMQRLSERSNNQHRAGGHTAKQTRPKKTTTTNNTQYQNKKTAQTNPAPNNKHGPTNPGPKHPAPTQPTTTQTRYQTTPLTNKTVPTKQTLWCGGRQPKYVAAGIPKCSEKHSTSGVSEYSTVTLATCDRRSNFLYHGW